MSTDNFFLAKALEGLGQVQEVSGQSGYFNAPDPTLDPTLFNGTVLKPEVRSWLLKTFYGYFGAKYKNAESWSTVWLAGSGISYQWSGDRGNGDLDVLIGVKFPEFFDNNIDYVGLSENELADMWNTDMKEHLWPLTDRTLIPAHGSPVAPAPRGGSVRTATVASPFTLTGNASHAFGHTSAPGISESNTESARKTTTGFWQSKAGTAPSAHEQSPAGQESTFTSTTITTPDESEGFSAIPATTASGFSGTTRQVSSESLNMSEGDGGKVFSVTFYINPGSTDIRDIHPYAAYDVSHNSWTVKPPVLPNNPETLYPKEWWDFVNGEKKHADDLLGRFNGLSNDLHTQHAASPGWANTLSAMGLVVDQARALFDDVHLGRKLAFGPGGDGYGDFHNFRWQAHKRMGTMQALNSLAAAKKQAKDETETVLYGGPIENATQALTRAALWNTPYRRA